MAFNHCPKCLLKYCSTLVGTLGRIVNGVGPTPFWSLLHTKATQGQCATRGVHGWSSVYGWMGTFSGTCMDMVQRKYTQSPCDGGM